MSAALLKEAADRLDALADAVDTSTIEDYGLDLTWAEQIGMIVRDPDAAYIAAMSPTVGKALAAWLREAARSGLPTVAADDAALAVARAVLGRDT